MDKNGGSISYWDADNEQDFLDQETKFITETRGRAPKNAVAMSGGGIRSATFSLGALQALSRSGVLEHMDYMSTVSGGGYLGGSLQWWWSGPNEAENQFDASSENFPYGTTDPQYQAGAETDGHASRNQRKILGHLRSHGNYLTPGSGIGIWSGVGILSRAIVLNLILWLTLAAGVFWLLIGLSDFLKIRYGNHEGSLGQVAGGFAIPMDGDKTVEIPFIFASLLCFAALIAVLFILFSIAYSISTYFGRAAEKALQQREKSDALSALHKLLPKMDSKYGWRRIYETFYQRTHPVFYGSLAIGLIPVLHAFAVDDKPGLQGLIATGIGVASGLWGYFGSMRKFAPGIATRIALPLGSLLFLYGGAILTYQLAMYVYDPVGQGIGNHASLVDTGFWVLLAVSIAMMFLVNINYISPHRFYRDRIMEAFMPAWSTVDTNSTGWSPLADRFRMSAAWPREPGKARSPFPIVNTNVVLVNEQPRRKHEDEDIDKNERHRRFRMRGGDNFVLTPFASGSLATGWCDTATYMGDNVTVASAVAISGAAANPNAAYLGSGHTRNRLVSVVMRLFNLRLGYWVANPRYDKRRSCKANHFRPGFLYTVTRRGHKSKRPIVELTDGGHFDNLGVYEMIRRRARVIVVCDGEADKETSYSAFVSLVRRVEEDFDTKIKFKKNRGPELLVEDVSMPYPSGAKSATTGFFVAQIEYPDQEKPGVILYLKATMIDGVSLKTKGYKGAYPDFPDETTADQFFDEVQFEAYRELGYAIAHSAVTALKLTPELLDDPESLINRAWRDDELKKKEVEAQA